jgi:hypothetical protein
MNQTTPQVSKRSGMMLFHTTLLTEAAWELMQISKADNQVCFYTEFSL